MLAATFITRGVEALRTPEPAVDATKSTLEGLAKLPEPVGPNVPTNAETVAKVAAGVQIGAGLLLAAGKLPRLSSAALAVSVVPGSLGTHAFWNETDPVRKASERRALLADVGLVGGLIIASVDTEGRPSLGWRGRRAARKVSEAVTGVLPSTSDTALIDSELVDRVGSNLQSGLHVARDRGAELAELARDRGAEFAEVAQKRGSELAEVAQKRGAEFAEVAQKRGAELADVAHDRSLEIAGTAQKRAPKLAKKVRNRTADLAEVARDRSAELAEAARDRTAELAEAARDRSVDLAETAQKRAPQYAKRAQDRSAELAEFAQNRSAELAEIAQNRTLELAGDAKGKAKKAKKKAEKEAKREAKRRWH